jgi:hypothetical protein
MRVVPTALQELLAAMVPMWKADLFTITLANGTIYRWTDLDVNINLLGYESVPYLFYAQGPLLQRSRLGVKNTVEVPEMVIKLSALDTDFVGGLGIKQQLHNGLFDGATVFLDRTFMVTKPSGPLVEGQTMSVTGLIGGTGAYAGINPTGGLFAGRMSQAKITAVGAELTVKGANVLMNQYVPRNSYQVQCLHTFCDAGCTLSEATFTNNNTCAAGTTNRVLQWGTVPGNPAVFTFGKITMTSGAAIGQIRTIKVASAAGITLQYPLYNTPATSDTFAAVQGCSKGYGDNPASGQDCTSYSNTLHFRGFPYVPTADSAILFAGASIIMKLVLLAKGALLCGLFT